MTTITEEKTFIEIFKQYMTEKSDVFSMFQEGVALNLVSLAMGRTFIDTNFEEEQMTNIWTILVGYSNYGRKSAILRKAKRMLPTEANLLPDEFTKEAFFTELSKNSKGLNIWDECATVLKQLSNTKSYLTSIDDTLMALYNGESRTKSLRSETITVKEPCFNLLWATTFSNFNDYVDKKSFCTGFMSRFLIIFGDECETIKGLNGQTSTKTKKTF